MYQQLILIGNLGNNPEMRFTASGVPVTNFRLAVSRRWTGADGQAQEKTTWFQVSSWNRQAEFVNQYLTKGRRVMVIGEVEAARPWTDRNGNLGATIEVTAREVRFMDSRPESNGQGGSAEEMMAAPEADNEKSTVPF